MEGPAELLNHGLMHLQQDTDFDNRMAMICIDNSVELMMKTYLGLPARITGQKISKKSYDEFIESFSNLLDAIQQFANDKLVGIELGDVEWYHRIRNQLYHEGNGITVEKSKVDGYAEIAKILFSNLFSMPQDEFVEIRSDSLVGEFLSYWVDVELELKRLAEKYDIKTISMPPTITTYRRLVARKIISESLNNQFIEARKFRNELVHGMHNPSSKDLKDHIVVLKTLLQKLREI